MKPPAFQLYASDFLAGTAHFTAEEVGIYIRMLCFQWDTGCIDPRRVKAVCGSVNDPTSFDVVLGKFDAGDDGMLRNARLERVRADYESYCQKQRENIQKRWAKYRGNTMVIPSNIPEGIPNAYQTDTKGYTKPIPNAYSPPPPPSTINNIGTEIPSEEDAVAQSAVCACAPEFARLVYQTWVSQEGKNANGISVQWVKYISKRWNTEKTAWLNGQHQLQKSNGNASGHNHAVSRNKGTYNENSGADYSKIVK